MSTEGAGIGRLFGNHLGLYLRAILHLLIVYISPLVIYSFFLFILLILTALLPLLFCPCPFLPLPFPPFLPTLIDLEISLAALVAQVYQN
jgi:hypothetical protein